MELKDAIGIRPILRPLALVFGATLPPSFLVHLAYQGPEIYQDSLEKGVFAGIVYLFARITRFGRWLAIPGRMPWLLWLALPAGALFGWSEITYVGTVAPRICSAPFPLEKLILMFLGIGLIGPVFEELLFRGLVIGSLEQIGRSPPCSILYSATLFALCHLSMPITPLYWLLTFLVGLFLGSMYLASRSLWPGILFHVAANSTQLAVIIWA